MGIDAQMYFSTRQHKSPTDVRRLASRLAETFGANEFSIWRSVQYGSSLLDDRHALEIITEYVQDGPSVFPAKGEQFIEVHLAGRYYGRGYERGHLPTYVHVAEWIEAHVPDAQIFYGGDSSGVLAAPFGRDERRALLAYFFRSGHEPYTSGFSDALLMPGEAPLRAPVCDFCGGRPFVRRGFGGRNQPHYASFDCDGCGDRIIERGDTRVQRSKGDFDKAMSENRKRIDELVTELGPKGAELRRLLDRYRDPFDPFFV